MSTELSTTSADLSAITPTASSELSTERFPSSNIGTPFKGLRPLKKFPSKSDDHPAGTGYVVDAVTASTTYPVPAGWSSDLLGNFFSGLRPLNGVPIFEDGNLSIDSADDAVGVIAAKDALVVLKSVDTRTERQRDVSLRATEVVMTADYGVFELDDSKGAALTLDAGTPATS